MTNVIFRIGQKVMFQQKHLIHVCVTRNIHVKYRSSSTRCLKVISMVKVSNKMAEQETLVHAPMLWAEEISKRALLFP